MKPGRRVYRVVRQRRRAFARKNWRLLAVLGAGWLIGGVIAVTFFGITGGPLIAAFASGALLVGGAWFFSYVLLLDGSFYRRMGGTAEEWTAGELRKLGRSWTALHNVAFDRLDIDHVAFGPKQVLAVETKYASTPLTPDRASDFVKVPDQWLDQARRGARKIRLLLHAAGIRDEEVKPVLVLWGPGPSSIEQPWGRVGDVTVLIGARAKEWRSVIRGTGWSRRPTHQARQAVEDYLARSSPSLTAVRNSGPKSASTVPGAHDTPSTRAAPADSRARQR